MLVGGLRSLLEDAQGVEVCGSAISVDLIPERLKSAPPDIFIVDIYFKFSEGFEILKGVQLKFPQSSILVFSMHDEAFYAERALHSGAKGYIMMNESSGEILRAIRQVADGGLYVSDRLKSILLSQLDTSSKQEIVNPIKKLTNRELQVIELIGQGKNNREISTQMNIRLKTVEAHRFRIKEKLNLKHSTELIQFAIHWLQREGRFDNALSS